MKKMFSLTVLAVFASHWFDCSAIAQFAPSPAPYYIPQGPQQGTYGFPLYFGYPGTTNGIMMTYNFGRGRVREFNYGMSLPNGVSFTRGLGGGNSGFAAGASSQYVNSMPPFGGGNVLPPIYSSPGYYLPTY